MIGPQVERLSALWRRHTDAPELRARVLVLVLASELLVHVARRGTPPARVGATLLVATGAIALGVWGWRRGRAWLDVRATLVRVLPSPLREAALRALGLSEATAAGTVPGSPALARLHLERVLARATSEGVSLRAERRGRRASRFALALFIAASLLALVAPLRLAEGLLVWTARGGQSLLPLPWIDAATLLVQAPTYLKQDARLIGLGVRTDVPVGSVVTLRMVPRISGRTYVLFDGEHDVPLADDGSGGLIARQTVTRDVHLEVGVRLGAVLIPAQEGLDLVATQDAPPEVQLGGAPRSVDLDTEPRVELRWSASDDHGLAQVDVVIETGGRSTRRVVQRYDDHKSSDQGGYALEASDPLLRRAFLPISVRIEAKDDDPVSVSKWGRSAALTLQPPALGRAEAERYAALLGGRDALVDFVAWQRGERVDARTLAQRSEDVRRTWRKILALRWGRLDVPRAVSSFVDGQLRVLVKAERPGESRVRRSEDVTLALDVVLRRLAERDAASVSRRLGDVVEEIELGARAARDPEQRGRADERMALALDVARGGARELARLGALGWDLGGVARGDLDRITRARGDGDLAHVERAAHHLAARLRRPSPSFSASGGGGGVEAGPGRGRGEGAPSRSDERFDQLAGELESLASEHSKKVGEVERALDDAERTGEREGLRDDARAEAEALRRGVGGLPRAARTPGTPTADAARARELAGAAAGAIERVELGDAVETLRESLEALNQADRARKASEDGMIDLDEEALEDARRALDRALSWTGKELSRMKDQRAKSAKDALGQAADAERKLAGRAGNLASRGQSDEASLPEASADSVQRAGELMQRAAQALESGDGEGALKLAREAQRLLEEAKTGRTGDAGEGDEGAEGKRRGAKPDDPPGHDGDEAALGGNVPGAARESSADAFRRRVVEGLGQGRGARLGPAVKRYAEGLLR